MKLRLSFSLRHAITSCVVMASLVSFAQAATITLTANPTNWSEDGANGYKDSYGYEYKASGILWTVSGGTYEISSNTNSSTDGYGICVHSNARLDNYGTLNVSTTGTTYPVGGISCRESEIVNNGNMNITAISSNEMASAYGFEADGKLDNKGNLNVNVKGYGYLDTGIGSDGELVNSGSIIVTTTSLASSDGAYHDCVGIWMGRTSVNEAGGSIAVSVSSAGNDGFATGFNIGHTFTNRGALKAEVITEGSAAINNGIYLNGGHYDEEYNWEGVLINEKTGSIKSNVNAKSDTVAYGIEIAGEFSKMFNEGSVETTSIGITNATAQLYFLDGSKNAAYTEGKELSISGKGIVHLGGSRDATNVVSGLTQGSSVNVSSGLSLSGVTLNLVDNVTLKMGGDLKVVNDVTTNWNYHSLTIDNGGTRHSVSWKNEFAGSWSGSFTLSENDGSLTMVQKQVDKYVGLSSGNITIGGGVLKATETLELGGSNTAMTISSDTTSLVLHGERGGKILNAIVGAEGIMVSAGDGNTLTLDSSVLTLGGGLNLLKNVMVIGSTQIKSELGSALSCDLVTFVLDSLNSSLGAQAVLAVEDDAALFMTPYTSGGTAIVGTNIFDNVTVSGDMTLDLSFWAEEIDLLGYDSLAFSLGDSIAEGTQIRASLDGVNYATAAYGADGMAMFSVADIKNASNIPEPTTATLSLLALTAFVARRRRKAA